MPRKLRLLLIAAVALTSCAVMPSTRLKTAEEKTLPEPSLEKIADGVWIHKSYENIEPWGAILSQGLVVKTNEGVFLIDTAWNDADTDKILALIEAIMGELPKAAIVTHAHQDKMGGMQTLHDAGVHTWAHALTNEDAVLRRLGQADSTLFDVSKRWSTQIDLFLSSPKPGQAREKKDGVIVHYPGAGHTRDNIVVYYEPAKILFGGCLIRPGKSNNLGNTADADIAHWADSVRTVAAEFPDAEIVIPSHGPKGGRELLDHTIALADAANE